LKDGFTFQDPRFGHQIFLDLFRAFDGPEPTVYKRRRQGCGEPEIGPWSRALPIGLEPTAGRP
jgi:hypothetical protein